MSSNFPSHWQTLPFEIAVADVTAGKTKLQGSEYSQSGVLPIIDQGQEFIGGYTDDVNNQANVTLPTIIFGDHTRVFKYVDFPFCLGADGTKILEPKVNLDKRFLFHYLKSLNISSAGYSRHYKFLKENVVPVPPLVEQKRIAAILDKADAIRRKRQQAIKLADEFLRAVFLDMFTSSKVKKFRKLGEVVKIVGGGTPSKSNSKYWGGSIPWASVKDFTSKVITTPQDFITVEGLKNSATNLIPKGTIIIPTRMALGKVAITGCDIAINQDLKALFLNTEDIAEVDFLIGFLETKASFIESNGKGATVKGVTLDFIKDIDVPIPEKKEQIRYARIRKKIFGMLSKSDSEVSKNLFDSLSQKVFSIN